MANKSKLSVSGSLIVAMRATKLFAGELIYFAQKGVFDPIPGYDERELQKVERIVTKLDIRRIDVVRVKQLEKGKREVIIKLALGRTTETIGEDVATGTFVVEPYKGTPEEDYKDRSWEVVSGGVEIVFADGDTSETFYDELDWPSSSLPPL